MSVVPMSVGEEPKVDEDVDKPRMSKTEEIKEKPKESKKVKKVKQEKSQEFLLPDKEEEKEKVPTSPKMKPKLQKEKKIDVPEKEPEKVLETADIMDEKPAEEIVEKEVTQEEPTVKEVDVKEDVQIKEHPTPNRIDSVRRKSKVFETAEMLAKSTTQDKIPQKKVFTGVKVGFFNFKLKLLC